jgi:hypothetical protein
VTSLSNLCVNKEADLKETTINLDFHGPKEKIKYLEQFPNIPKEQRIDVDNVTLDIVQSQ